MKLKDAEKKIPYIRKAKYLIEEYKAKDKILRELDNKIDSIIENKYNLDIDKAFKEDKEVKALANKAKTIREEMFKLLNRIQNTLAKIDKSYEGISKTVFVIYIDRIYNILKKFE